MSNYLILFITFALFVSCLTLIYLYFQARAKLKHLKSLVELEEEKRQLEDKIQGLKMQEVEVFQEVETLRQNALTRIEVQLESERRRAKDEIQSIQLAKEQFFQSVEIQKEDLRKELQIFVAGQQMQKEQILAEVEEVRKNSLRAMDAELESEWQKSRDEIQKIQTIKDNFFQLAESQKDELRQRLEAQKSVLHQEIHELKESIKRLQEELKPLEDESEYVESGLYEPLYDFDSLDRYTRELESLRQKQKEMIKNKEAVVWYTAWTVNGSTAQGRKMQNENTRLMLRAFNGECDALITKVKYNNVVAIEKRIWSLYDAINKLGRTNHSEISYSFSDLKIQELKLVHEYHEKKQAIIEEQRQIREQMREEELARREIEKAILEAEREEARYQKALQRAREEIERATGEKYVKLEYEIKRLNELLIEAQTNRERVKSRAEMTRSGYVYIISNIGSFGENVYKIGMIRRLDPMDRVYELGDASVPFSFDVHAMIFSEDAPRLESKLHQTFDHRRVNRINLRKEFFRVTIEEIKAEAIKLKADVLVTMKAEAKDYWKTQAIINKEGDLSTSQGHTQSTLELN
jgi:hypothetical protein